MFWCIVQPEKGEENMKRTRKIFLMACLLICGMIFYGCGSNGYKSSMDAGGNAKSDTSASNGMGPVAEDEAASGEVMEGGSMEDIMDDSMDYSKEIADSVDTEGVSLEGSQTGEGRRNNEKLIYTYRYSVETKEFEDFTEKIAAKTVQLGGYVENSETNGSASDGLNRYANMTLRIPADQVHQMLSMLDTESNVTYHSSTVENVSLQYTDMQSHIKALRTEQDTLMRLLEQAEKLKDIIELQSKLSDVRYEIESYEAQLRLYDNMIDYSTIHLDISEVERTTTVTPARASFGKEVKDRFSDNLYGVGQFLRASAVWLIGSLPVLIPAAVLIWLLVLLIRKWRRALKSRISASTRYHAAGYQSIYAKKRGRGHDDQKQPEQNESVSDGLSPEQKPNEESEQGEGQKPNEETE